MIVYMNSKKIYTFFNALITNNNKIDILSSNEYKRKYDYERFTNIEDYIPYSKEDIKNIFYNILNNGWREFVFYCPKKYEECVKDVESISQDSLVMGNISGYVSPLNSFSTINTVISSYNEIYINVTKKYSDEEIKDINDKMNELFVNLKLDGKSKEEKLKIFHNYLIKNTIYDQAFADTQISIYNSSKANGALIEGHAVCGGYTDAMAIFLDILNIPNIILSNENHTWNMVYLNDEWLHIDATWNDTENDKYKYQFYLISTDKLLKLDTSQHNFQTEFFIESIKE